MQHHLRAFPIDRAAVLIVVQVECVPSDFFDLVDIQLHRLYLGLFGGVPIDDFENLVLHHLLFLLADSLKEVFYLWLVSDTCRVAKTLSHRTCTVEDW